MSNNFALTKRITPTQMGINAMAGDESSNEGNWIDARGYNQVTLFIEFLASGDADSGNMTFSIEVSDDAGDTSFFLQSAAVSSGVATLSKLVYTSDTNNPDHKFAVDFPCNYPHFRITDMAVATGHANDDITVSAILGKL